MTVGQRIAQKRKELGLSQEGLGDQLGVSRQAIYKWESDASLPEIEKLVALSRIFSVSVGWLLGEEEHPGAQTAELTEAQLKMAQEIAERYLAAQKPPEPKRRSRLPLVLMGLVAVVLAATVFANLFSRLEEVSRDYGSLQNAIANVSSSVNGQIGSIERRVEEILKAQNSLTASYSAQFLSADPGEGTATFTLEAVPKTYVEGMEALFLADCGSGEALEFPGTLGDGQSFSAEIDVPLTDSITLSVVFVTGEKRETQVLDVFTYLLSDTFPQVWFYGNTLWGSVREEGVLPDRYATLRVDSTPASTRLAELEVGLFRDRKLIAWYTPCEKPDSYQGDWGDTLFFEAPEGAVLEDGDTYCIAARATDEYGRQWMTCDTPAVYNAQEGFLDITDIAEVYSSDPAEWDFTA